MAIKYGTIKYEATNCLRRFRRAGTKKRDLVMFFHHGVTIEPLPEPFETRIEFILSNKPKRERAIRLHWFRPIPKRMFEELPENLVAAKENYDAAAKEYDAAWKEYDAAWKEYDAASKEYDAAWKEYDAASKEYDAAAKEYDAAWEKCAPQISTLIKKYFPECPWDGESIV